MNRVDRIAGKMAAYPKTPPTEEDRKGWREEGEKRRKEEGIKPRKAGTWAMPRDPNAVRMLGNIIKMLKDGKSPQDRNDVQDSLYPLLGDDRLFDDIGKLEKEYHKKCGAAAVRRLKELAGQNPADFKNPEEYENVVSLAVSL